MAQSGFQSLRVYQMAEKLADQTWDIVLAWDAFAKRMVGAQLVRAADSVGANIAEGHGRRDARDNRRFVRIALGSLNEAQHFLRRAFVRKLISNSHIKPLKLLLEELAPSLNAYHQSIGKTRPAPAPDSAKATQAGSPRKPRASNNKSQTPNH